MQWQDFFLKQLNDVRPYEPGMREEQIRDIAQVDVIHKLSSNECPYPPFDTALKAMGACLPLLNEYADGSQYDLKARLAQKYGVEQKQVMVGNGANELLCLLAQSCLDTTARVAYCWPSFVVYKMSAQLAGAQFDEAPLTPDGRYDLQALLAAIQPNTKIVYICSPNNPSGGVVTRAEFAQFMAAVPAHVLVVVDNAYIEFIGDEDAFDPMEYFDGVRPLVVLRSFSKIYGMAGARVGYGFAPTTVVEAIDKVREPFNVNTVAQVGALASLDDEVELARRRTANAAQRTQLYELFDRLGLRYYQSSANFVWVFLPDAQQVFEQLLRRGVIVRPFPGAATAAGANAGGLRVGVGNSKDTAATIAAFEELFAS
jgi:histidinol-phosphate aminotransferase